VQKLKVGRGKQREWGDAYELVADAVSPSAAAAAHD
jgi:hypothetical protein